MTKGSLCYCVLGGQVAHRMSKPLADLALRPESAVDIRRSCKEDLDHYPDVTLHLQLQLQLAIANDDFERAGQCGPPPPPLPVRISTAFTVMSRPGCNASRQAQTTRHTCMVSLGLCRPELNSILSHVPRVRDTTLLPRS